MSLFSEILDFDIQRVKISLHLELKTWKLTLWSYWFPCVSPTGERLSAKWEWSRQAERSRDDRILLAFRSLFSKFLRSFRKIAPACLEIWFLLFFLFPKANILGVLWVYLFVFGVLSWGFFCIFCLCWVKLGLWLPIKSLNWYKDPHIISVAETEEEIQFIIVLMRKIWK